MYIAFKWLVSLASIMWLAMCIADWLIKESLNICNAGFDSKHFEDYKKKSEKTQIKSILIQEKIHHNYSYYDKERSLSGIHFIMFLTGALAVTVTAFHNKQKIILYFARRNMGSNNLRSFLMKKLLDLEKGAIQSRVTISKYVLNLWEKLKIAANKVYEKGWKTSHTVKHSKINMLLLKKLREMAEERKSLGQLLITAIHENKNIRMQYELENMTKVRLMQHIETTQKQIKENRSRYVSFQHLYLVTHQENMYLKACLRKLRQEKEDTERNLIGLINEIYRSKNNKLKAYCTRFIVKTKDKILNTDLNAEIKEFLEKTCKSSKLTLFEDRSVAKRISPNRWHSGITLEEDNNLVTLVAEAPKLRGLPGEYVWTVKDKDGIIEKLYEYDIESDFDNGDTIRRIRQYSVYYDKDCLLDFSKVRHEARTCNTSICPSRSITSDHFTSKQKIVTSSEAFQKFLQSNIDIVQTKPSAPPLLYG